MWARKLRLFDEGSSLHLPSLGYGTYGWDLNLLCCSWRKGLSALTLGVLEPLVSEVVEDRREAIPRSELLKIAAGPE